MDFDLVHTSLTEGTEMSQPRKQHDRTDRDRQRGQGPQSQPGSQASQAGFYSEQRIASLPGLPWQPAEAKTVVARTSDLSNRLFRGEPQRPYEERSRPGGVLLQFILTCFSGTHQIEAMEKMGYLLGETPINEGVVSTFRQTARLAQDAEKQELWLTNQVRAIEYGTLILVNRRIHGASARTLRSQAHAIDRDIRTVLPVLEAMGSTRRLAITHICQVALGVSMGEYERVITRLERAINELGQEFDMQTAAQQLTSGLMSEAEWAETGSAYGQSSGQRAFGARTTTRQHQPV